MCPSDGKSERNAVSLKVGGKQRENRFLITVSVTRLSSRLVGPVHRELGFPLQLIDKASDSVNDN